jgi:hypothetical protein
MPNYSNSKKLTLWWLKRKRYFSEPKLGIISWEEGVWAKTSNLVNETLLVQIPDDHSHVMLGYVIQNDDGSRKKCHYPVYLTKQTCHFGGFRYFFICPLGNSLIPCKRRTTVLYKPEHSSYFGCRVCHKIRYFGQVVSQKYRHRQEVRNFMTESRIERLEGVGFKRHYRGKITKRYKKLESLYKKVDSQ